MKFSFSAKIEKVGINPCVKVPPRITKKMKAVKGYIPIKGTIEKHGFEQTLCVVKGEGFRLYVNGPMLKGSGAGVGDTVKFSIEENHKTEKEKELPVPAVLAKVLKEEKLADAFKALAPYRRKEIVKYLGFLKSDEAMARNVNKVIAQLRKGSATARIP